MGSILAIRSGNVGRCCISFRQSQNYSLVILLLAYIRVLVLDVHYLGNRMQIFCNKRICPRVQWCYRQYASRDCSLSQSFRCNILNNSQILLKGLSEKIGSHIYAKAEFQNPGGSVKDRAALGLVHDAEQRGLYDPYFASFSFILTQAE